MEVCGARDGTSTDHRKSQILIFSEHRTWCAGAYSLSMHASRLLYSRRETAQLLSVGLRTVDQLVLQRKLEVRRIGKRVLVTADSLRQYAKTAGK